ncbi:MAG TPA: hypothetical protein VH297_06390, partial [Gaiellaceae bacterium]
MTPSAVRRFRHIPLLALAVVLGAIVSGAGPALSALPSGAAVTTASGMGTTVTVKRPSTTAAGDVLVASVDARLSSSASITAPGGWSLVRRDSSSAGKYALTQALYYKVAGSAEPAEYAWTLSSSASGTGAILDFKNVDRRTPIDSHSGASDPNTRFPTAPSVTATVPGDIVVGFFAIANGKTMRTPAGMTEQSSASWQSQPWELAAEAAAYVQSRTGASGSKTAKSRGHARPAIGQLVALRTVSQSTPPPPP